MKAFASFVFVATSLLSIPPACSEQARQLPATVEVQVDLLSLELPAKQTDRVQVSAAMTRFAQDHKFRATDTAQSPMWNIQRFYVDKNQTSMVLSFFPEHTFIGLSKRPDDSSPRLDLVHALQSTFGPLGFNSWVEPQR
ncbi:MAG: hypothetical protein ACRYG8_17195 [Janthinobacterium lividum]